MFDVKGMTSFRGVFEDILHVTVVGPERLGVFALFYDWAKDGRGFPMIGSGRNRYQLLDVEDLCDAIYLTATLAPEKVNDVFNIGAKVFATRGP